MQYLVLVVGVIAILLLVLGDRLFPGKPVALGVVALSIAAATLLGLPALGLPTTGEIPAGLPGLAGPTSCMPNLPAAALLYELSAPMERCAIYCEPRALRKKSVSLTAP
jgi:MFS superfamily sulfate permease-like transporter